MGHYIAETGELSRYVHHLALRSSQSESKLCQLRWRWLLQPSELSARELVDYLQHQKQTPTEMAMEFENTIAWISLFDPAFINRRFHHARLSIFEKIEKSEVRFENLLIRYLVADRNGYFNQSQSLLARLREAFSTRPAKKPLPTTEPLLESIEFLNPQHQQKSSSKITVYLGHWEIQAHGKKFISKPLCVFIELLRTNISISFDELLAAAFDIPKYNNSFHYQKVQNLISRLRFLSSDFLINTRQGRIYSSIKWEEISVISMSRHQQSLKQSNVLNLFLESEAEKGAIEKCAIRVSISKLKSTLDANFSRAEFEKVTGFPRSTASRFLKNWLDQDILGRTGNGKATSYSFK